MDIQNKRRHFLKQIALGGLGTAILPWTVQAQEKKLPELPDSRIESSNRRKGVLKTFMDKTLDHVAFPIGGLGAGMFCLEGTGAISHVSVRNHPEMYNEPGIFAAISAKKEASKEQPAARILEGPVPEWKIFGPRESGLGDVGKVYGLPRFKDVKFESSFPYSTVYLKEEALPIEVQIDGWSPFIPTDHDNSGLPAGSLIYSIKNTSKHKVEAVFSFNSKNFMATDPEAVNSILPLKGGFILHQGMTEKKNYLQSDFAIFTEAPEVKIDHCWFRGNWWDPLSITWNTINSGSFRVHDPVEKDAPGASLYVPFVLEPGKQKVIRVSLAWYCPNTNLRMGDPDPNQGNQDCFSSVSDGVHTGKVNSSKYYKPWYAGRFENIQGVVKYWRAEYVSLFAKTRTFNQALFASTLPDEVMEAVSANLSILKSPTILRQYDGRLWCWEGSGDDFGSCHGSCTHVWNYAQAITHLFPALERTLRNTEFCENQNKAGHQTFRANLPISATKHDFHAAADGQLGGIMKVYRDWRICGDTLWLEKIFPKVKISMDFCIENWDPKHKGIIEEPHHNTYDIEFWGPDGMCTSFYLGALSAFIKMSIFLKSDVKLYEELFKKGKTFLETQLFNKEYFVQQIAFKGLKAADPTKVQSFGGAYSPEAIELLQKEGPKYQYGEGCLSDGILGAWIGKMCGLGDFIDPEKVSSHLLSVHRYNLRDNLWQHANPQRPGFALDADGGLLLCTWPHGGKLSLPFVYSNEVWTGIEYQVASHLMLMGKVTEGLDIVRACRGRYDGRIRNPYNEYECGHFYARALASYGLLQGLTGLQYDSVDQHLKIDSQIGDFVCFLSTATGFGTVTLRKDVPTVKVVYGQIPIKSFTVNGRSIENQKKG